MLLRRSWLLLVCLVVLAWSGLAWSKGRIVTRNAPGCAGQSYTFACLDCYGGDMNWDFGDGGSANGGEVSHVFNAPGTYTVTLSIDWVGFIDADGDGEKEYYSPDGTVDEVKTVTVTVQDCSSNEEDATENGDGRVGHSATDSDNGSGSVDQVERPKPGPKGYIKVRVNPGCVNEEYIFACWDCRGGDLNWDFGDGAHANGGEVAHVFAEPGTYTVQLEIDWRGYIDGQYYVPDGIVDEVKTVTVTVGDCRAAGQEEEPVSASSSGTDIPGLEVTCTPGKVRVGEEVVCRATWDRHYTVASYWYFSQPVQVDNATRTRVAHVREVRFVPEAGGVLTVTFRGHDMNSERRAEVVRTVTVESACREDVGLCATEEECLAAGGAWIDGRCYDNETAQCVLDPANCTAQSDCEDNGWFWYEGQCYADEATACASTNGTWDGETCQRCSVDHFELCASAAACSLVGGVWVDDQCLPPVQCTSDNLTACVTEEDCKVVGGFWDEALAGCLTEEQFAMVQCERDGGVWEEGNCTFQCSLDHLEQCVTKEDCEAVGGVWHHHACQRPAEKPEARVEAKVEEIGDQVKVKVKVHVKNKEGLCYYLGAYHPDSNTVFFIHGKNKISTIARALVCEPGPHDVEAFDAALRKSGLHLYLYQAFMDQEGNLVDLKLVKELSL